MRELKPLRLPQLVEAARKNQEADMITESTVSIGHAQHPSGSSTISDLPSPTFSLRGHSRLLSSTSSLASSPVMRESMDGFGSSNRPLTDVKEEPLDKIEDYEVVNGFGGHRAREGKQIEADSLYARRTD